MGGIADTTEEGRRRTRLAGYATVAGVCGLISSIPAPFLVACPASSCEPVPTAELAAIVAPIVPAILAFVAAWLCRRDRLSAARPLLVAGTVAYWGVVVAIYFNSAYFFDALSIIGAVALTAATGVAIPGLRLQRRNG